MKPTPVRIRDVARSSGDCVRFYVPTPSGDWHPITWSEVDTAIQEVAVWLWSEGLGAGTSICIFAPNSVEWLYAALGAQAAGGVLVPIYPSSTASQAGYIIRHSEASLVFVGTQELLERTLSSGELTLVKHIVFLDDCNVSKALEVARSTASNLPEDIEERLVSLSNVRGQGRSPGRAPGKYDEILSQLSREQPCLMLYTSGTTGNPKGVPLSYENVLCNSEDWVEVLGPLIPEEPVDLLWLPMSHIFGWGEACLGFELGFTSYLSAPQEVIDLLPVVRPSVFMSVPAYWEKLAAGALAEFDPQRQPDRLRQDTGGRLAFCLSGGAGLDRSVKELFESAGLLIIEGYGLTEASPTLTMNRPQAYWFDSVGLPFPRVELRLADDGEILAKGPNIFSGYHKDPTATEQAFTSDGWLRTGDLGRFTDDGFLQIIGRKKEILVTAGGKNISPNNIETLFAKDDLIEHLVVYGDAKRYIVAGVWLFESARKGRTEAEIRGEIDRRIQAANTRLAQHETIKKYVIMSQALSLDGGTLTPTLKKKRGRIYSLFRDSFEALYA